jgi:hypothetical protein
MRRPDIFPLARFRTITIIITIVSIFVLSGCDESDGENPVVVNQPTDIFLKEYSIPSFWVLNSNIYRDLKIELDLPDDVKTSIESGGMEYPVVYLGFSLESNPADVSYIQLFDEGSIDRTTLPEYQNPTSGDLVTNDFKYQTRINTNFASDQSIYDVKFYAGWFNDPSEENPLSNETVPTSFTMTVEINSPPVITVTNFPDTLHSGFLPEVWTLDVVDADIGGGDEVVDVKMTLFSSLISIPRERVFTKDSGSIWKYSADSTFSEGLPTGDYRFQFDAMDLFDQKADSVDHEVYVINTAPWLENPLFPDTVYQPVIPGEINLYHFRVEAFDYQGLVDIDSVYFDMNLPNGQPILRHFRFGDEGDNGDAEADDGKYTYPLEFTSEGTSVLGTYTFRFFAKDRAGNLSESKNGQFVKLEEPGE